jgi:hypothetical protein
MTKNSSTNISLMKLMKYSLQIGITKQNFDSRIDLHRHFNFEIYLRFDKNYL